MRIANPIYDTVFKFIMNNNKIAKFVLSQFLEKNIVELEYIPKDVQIKKFHEDYDKEQACFSVYYMDFVATTIDEHGKKENIIIELQKARTHTDVTRFRHYIGMRYLNKNGEYEVTLRNGTVIKTAPHIQAIYILGHRLENAEYAKHLALKYTGKLIDPITNEKVEISEDPFVDALTHDSLYIQVPNIKKEKDINNPKSKKGLEAIAGLFDQKGGKRDQHNIDINDEQYPGEYKKLLRLLHKASLSPEIEDEMEIEDIITDEIERDKERLKEAKEEIEIKDKALEDNKKALEDKDKALANNKKELENKDKELAEAIRKIKEFENNK